MPTRAHKTGFLKRTLRLGGKRYLYQVYLPPSWKKSTKFPVILFLHGAGERGSDGDLQTRMGAGTAIRAHAERFPFIVVFPQCPRDSQWPKGEMQSLALKTLEHAVKEFNGDTRRIYLTGISMGGYGAWALAAANPGKFAALVVICGGVHTLSPARRHSTVDPYVSVAEALGHSPVWIFHGANDPAVPVTQSRANARCSAACRRQRPLLRISRSGPQLLGQSLFRAWPGSLAAFANLAAAQSSA